MSRKAGKWAVTLERRFWAAPAAVFGLYAGRLLAEQIRPGLALAILLSLLAVFLCLWLFRRTEIGRTWPLLILAVYVSWPEPDPRISVSAALAALIALLQVVGLSTRAIGFPNRAAGRLIAALLAAGFFALYVNTLAPDVLPADAGELQLVAARWGVAHPTGYALYTILANIATRLPIGLNPAYRANLFSAFTSALALLFLYLGVCKLTGKRSAGLLAAVALGTSTTFWSQATTANVRSLTALFTAAALYVLLLLREARVRPASDPPPQPSSLVGRRPRLARHLLWRQALFVLLLVLAVTHHSSLIFIGGLFAIYAVMIQPSYLREPARWPFFVLSGLIALLPLVYLPLRAAAGAVGAPENLDTLGGFVNHVLGLGFRGDLFYFDELPVLLARLRTMVNVLTFQFSPLVLLFMVFGLIVLFRADRLLAILLAASIAVHTLVAALYRAPQTVEYMVPAYVLLGVVFGYLGGALRRFLSRVPEDRQPTWPAKQAATLLFTAMILVVFAQCASNYGSFRQLAGDSTARDYAQQLLQDAPPEAVVLADWHWATPLQYLQALEGVRPDVQVTYVFPETGPYADTWVARIAGELVEGRSVIATHYDPSAYGRLPLAEPFHEAFLFRQEPLQELPDGYETVTTVLAPGLLVEGVHVASDEAMPGQELVVELAWRGKDQNEPGRKIYAHLVGLDGRLYGSDDQLAEAQSEGLTISRLLITPLLHTPPGTYDLIIGSYGASEVVPARAATMARISVRASNTAPITRNPLFRPLTDSTEEKRLIGYDWDSTLPGKQRLYLHWSSDAGYETQGVDIDGGQYTMAAWYGPWGVEVKGTSFTLDRPSAYVPFGKGLVWLGSSRTGEQSFSPGHRVKLTERFTTSRPPLVDLVVSVRLVGYQEDGRSWDWWDLDDGVPAMGAIPTLKWIAGSRVDHTVYPTVSRDARPDQEAEPLLLLYDAFTSRQLPILDERITGSHQWIPLGRVRVSPDS